jgi:protein-disulfide isomerase/uncharacterized membrane protein
MSSENLKQSRTPYIILILLAIGLSGYLLVHHVKITEGIQTGVSICSISKNLDCDVVARSQYSTLLGIPVASFGLVFYLTLLGIVLFGRAKCGVSREQFNSVMLFFSVLTLPPTFYLLYLMSSVIGSYCIFCAMLDFINILLVIIAIRAIEAGQKPVTVFITGARQVVLLVCNAFFLKSCARVTRIKAISVVMTLLALFLTVYFLPQYLSRYVFAEQKREQEMQLKVELQSWSHQWNKLQPSSVRYIATYPKENADFIKGPLSASISIVEFADFQCPHCRRASYYLDQLVKKYNPQLNVVFKNYPLDSSCNGYMGHAGHPSSCLSAYIAICAGFEDSALFWEAHDELFDLGFYNEASLEKLYSELALNKSLADCSKDPAVISRVRSEVELANKLEVQGTPALFVYSKGKLLRVKNPLLLEPVINWLLAKN